MSLFTAVLDETDAGQRLDAALPLLCPSLSRASAAKLCESGAVQVNGRCVSKSYRIVGGESLQVDIPDPVPDKAEAQDIPLDVVYEDEHLLVVNKPRGMVVHPAAGHADGTLVNALLHHCKGKLSGINGVLRPGIVHRLDKDTSGLLIVAKTDEAHRHLAEQIRVHSFTRRYRAVVWGHFKEPAFTVDAPIARSPKDRQRMAVVEGGRQAITHVEVQREFKEHSLVQLTLETGRTHQIRVHMQYMGHPVLGDLVYAPKRPDHGLQGQCLHAEHIAFIHPVDGRQIALTAPLPAYFEAVVEKLSR